MADIKGALEQHVKRRLEDTFGKSVAMLIVMSATSAANVPVVDLTADQYRELCRAICSDPRVQNMWGPSGADAQLSDWERLVRKLTRYLRRHGQAAHSGVEHADGEVVHGPDDSGRPAVGPMSATLAPWTMPTL